MAKEKTEKKNSPKKIKLNKINILQKTLSDLQKKFRIFRKTKFNKRIHSNAKFQKIRKIKKRRK